MPNNTNLIFMVSDPKNFRDVSEETEEEFAERRRREDRIEYTLGPEGTLCELICWALSASRPSNSCPSSLPNRASKQSPTHGLGTKFPLWILAGPACWQSDGAAIPNRFPAQSPILNRSQCQFLYPASIPVIRCCKDGLVRFPRPARLFLDKLAAGCIVRVLSRTHDPALNEV